MHSCTEWITSPSTCSPPSQYNLMQYIYVCTEKVHVVLQTEIHWYGWIAMTFYVCAFIFYMYVRIAHSLDLGRGYIWYGIYLLCVEVLGFTTTIIYGLNLLWNPVIEQFPEDPESPGRPKVSKENLQLYLSVI